jgi:hypothetical protein
MQIIKLTPAGTARVSESTEGMTFIVDAWTDGERGKVAHVRDYRYPSKLRPFQIWSIAAGGYELIVDVRRRKYQRDYMRRYRKRG